MTYNLKDFPTEVLSHWGLSAQHPDEFITHLLDLSPGVVCAAVKRQRANLKNPPMTVEDLLLAFERQSLPQTVAELHKYAALL